MEENKLVSLVSSQPNTVSATGINGKEEYPLTPRDFQWPAIDLMRKDKRILNRDSFGLGKTLEGAYASVGNTLISCPNSLTQHWFDWLSGVESGPNAHPPYAPYGRQRVVLCKGSAYQRLIALQTPADFHIINHEMCSSHGAELIELADRGNWQTFIADEAHHFRNHVAQRSMTAVEIARRVEYCFPLTGSPIWKEVDDLFMLFRLLHPNIFTSYYRFVDTFCIADDSRYGTKVLGAKKSMIPELDELLRTLSIGRSYKEAGRQLPPLITKYIPIEFPPALRKQYDNMIDNYRVDWLNETIRFENYAQIMRTMRLMTAFPGKLEAVKDIVEDAHNSDPEHKTVIFCWYRETCDDLARVTGGVSIHGGITDPAERRRLALGADIVCATIASLTEGVDLSKARTIIFAEEHYTPGAMEQALARVQRERQDQDNSEPIVLCYVQVKNTVDEVIHNTNKRREGTARSVLKETLGVA